MPIRRSLARLLAVALPSALALPLIGCTPESNAEPDEPVGIYHQPIRDGYSDSVDTGVIGIFDSSVGALCSGSLIAPNVVLTARHCVSSVSETVQCGQAMPGALHAAKYFYVTTHPDLNSQNPADYHTVREVIGVPLDPNSSDPLLNKEDLCGRDQAILILSDNIAPSEAVPWVPRVDSEVQANEQYYAIGFGATDDNGSGAGIRRRRDNLFVTCSGGKCPDTYVKSTEIIGDTGICQGDSGGPAIDMKNRVFGVTSRGSLGCDSPVYGDVFGWGQWIKDVVKYAAQDSIGHYPAPPWTDGKSTDPEFGGDVGGSCDAPECTSHLCINTGTDLGKYCTHRCDAVNTCADGFECSEKYGNVCTQKPEPVKDPGTGDTSGGGKNNNNNNSSGGCSVSGLDPTKPIPWKSGMLVLGAALGALSRWGRRRPQTPGSAGALAARRRRRH